MYKKLMFAFAVLAMQVGSLWANTNYTEVVVGELQTLGTNAGTILVVVVGIVAAVVGAFFAIKMFKRGAGKA